MVVRHCVSTFFLDLFLNNRSQIISAAISALSSLDHTKNLKRNTLREIFKCTEFSRRHKFFTLTQRNFGIILMRVV